MGLDVNNLPAKLQKIPETSKEIAGIFIILQFSYLAMNFLPFRMYKWSFCYYVEGYNSS